MVSLGGVRDDTGLGEDRRFDVRAVEELRCGFDKKQSPLRAGFEIGSAGFVVCVVRTVGSGESFVEQDDERVAGFMDGAADLFLALRDGCADRDDAMRSHEEAVRLVAVYLRLRKRSRAMERGFEGVFVEEHVTKGGTCDVSDEGALMDAEEVGVVAFEP